MYHIIINPASRSGKGLKIWKELIEPALHVRNVVYRSYFSEKTGDAARLAREITFYNSSDRDLTLIILGGDGTMNEALQGIERPGEITIGYIPTGSSNDLARDLGIPSDPVKALDLILNTGAVHTMDIGYTEYPDGSRRLFAVSCGIGFDAAVCEETFRSGIKRFLNRFGLGKLTYLGIAVKQLFAAKAVSCDLILDHQESVHISRVLFVACMNHRYEGGGFQFCPDARDDDGYLNLCAVGDLPKLLILFALPTAFFGKHYLFPGITAYRARHIQFKTSFPLWVHTDGEVSLRADSFCAGCLRDRIRIIY